MSLDRDAAQLLQRLIRHRTVNPPGNERALQEELAGELRDAGFEVTLAGRVPERPNLVAQLRGATDGPTLGLLSHVDTVPADAGDWSRDPWGGDEVDGEIWGRGAQDMKSQTAAEVAAAIDLARGGWRPARGTLSVISVVDEEHGGGDGAEWLCSERPDLARCDYLVNEGAGALMPHDGQRVFGVCIAEKGIARFRIVVRGRPGHASMPALADNPLPRLAALIAALGDARVAHDVTEAPRELLAALGHADVEALRAVDPALAAFVEPMLSVTFAPTIVEASSAINVVPASAAVRVDCRVPPGIGREDVARRLAEALAGVDVEYELTWDESGVDGNGSPAASPLMDAIRDWVAGEEPQARVVPFMLPAYTDSRTFRAAFPDCVAYGFFPQREMTLHEMWPLVHGIDERIAARDVAWAAGCYQQLARTLLG